MKFTSTWCFCAMASLALSLTALQRSALASEPEAGGEDVVDPAVECSERNLEACDRQEIIEWVEWAVSASPDQVERRLSLDALPGDPLFRGRWLDDWFARKARVDGQAKAWASEPD
jgi:hypothetical protein